MKICDIISAAPGTIQKLLDTHMIGSVDEDENGNPTEYMFVSVNCYLVPINISKSFESFWVERHVFGSNAKDAWSDFIAQEYNDSHSDINWVWDTLYEMGALTEDVLPQFITDNQEEMIG